MALVVCLTIAGTLAVCALLLGFCCARVVRHMQSNPEAANAVLHHVVMPLLGKRPEVKPAKAAVSNGEVVTVSR